MLDVPISVPMPGCHDMKSPLNIALSLSGTAQAGPPIQSLGNQQAAFGQFGANTSAFNNSNTFGGNNSSTMFGAPNSSFSANTSVNIGTKRNKH